jgi:hypothetical protein
LEPLGRRSNPQIAHTVSISMLRLKNALIKIHIFMDVKEKGLITRAKNGGIFMMDEPQIFTLNFLKTSLMEVNES